MIGYRSTAVAAVEALKQGAVSPLELVNCAAERIAATDAALNATPTLCLERARQHAQAIMAGQRPRGLLHGLPILVKDLTDVAGVRTTYGSSIYAEHIPQQSDILVQRLENQGAIVLGKTNTPEFGAGASTFNDVFGTTRNPWDTRKSVAGSSGGSAAALAAGQAWLATGSDLGGSLRTPASFNSVVGLRPSPGRVASGPRTLPWDTLMVDGPLARTVADCALMLDAMVGAHPHDPLAIPAPAQAFLQAVQQAVPPQRVAFSPNLGIVPVDNEVATLCQQAAEQFAALGTQVDTNAAVIPDFSSAIDSFQILRAALFAGWHQPHLHQYRQHLKPEVIWNIEKGLALTAADLAQAELVRGELCQAMARFFGDYDLLLCPTAIVPPFAAEMRYLESLNGQRFDNYVHWIAITFVLTLTGCPVLSLPAGFTATGLPVGVQLVAPPRGEAQLLAAAALLEQQLGGPWTPIDPQWFSCPTP